MNDQTFSVMICCYLFMTVLIQKSVRLYGRFD